MPRRELIYEMGGKDGKPPDVREIFLKTRKVDRSSVEPETLNKYEEITKTIESEPSLNNLQVVEKCFGRQRHGHVLGYGGGIKRKDFESTSQTEELRAKLSESTSQTEELKALLQSTQEENRMLIDRMSQFEHRLVQMENERGRGERSNTNTSSSNVELHE